MNDQIRISIDRYSIHAGFVPSLSSSHMYNGRVPATKNMDPDLDFVRQLLENYKSVG